MRYFQDQIADLSAENNTFCQLQEQAIVDNVLVANLFIVSPPGNNKTSGTIDHELRPSLSVTLANTFTNKHCFKLADPFFFTNSKDSVPVKH